MPGGCVCGWKELRSIGHQRFLGSGWCAAVFNKAREGSGASLAGVELLDAEADEGVRFRAWALGDSCVIQLRGNQVVSSKPMDTSARFSHVPTLLMTAPGYEARYVRFWQSWESVLLRETWCCSGPTRYASAV